MIVAARTAAQALTKGSMFAFRRVVRALLAAAAVSAIFMVVALPLAGVPLSGGAVIAVCVTVCVLAAPRFSVVVGVVWAVVAIGWTLQLRLGASVESGAMFLLLSAAGFAAATAVIRLNDTRLRTDATLVGKLALGSLGCALALRIIPIAFDEMQSGRVAAFGFSLQIGEFSRILLVAGIAAYLWWLKDKIEDSMWSVFDRRMFFIGASLALGNIGLLMYFDTGPAVIVVVASAGTAMLAFRPLRQIVRRVRFWAVLVVVLGVAIFAVINLNVTDRLAARFNDVNDPGFQLRLGLQSAQQGGLFGGGLGSSSLAAHIPVATSDYLPAVFAADFGLVPLSVVVAVLLICFGSLYRRVAAKRTPTAVVAAGLSIALITQTVITALGPLGAVPLTGLSMPALTVTGSTVISTMLSLGVVCAVAAERPVAVDEARLSQKRLQQFRAPDRVEPPGLVLALGAGVLVYCCVLALLPINSSAAGLYLERGQIRTAEGDVIATTDATGLRTYPAGSLYSDLGYARIGDSSYGIENTAQDLLTCGGSSELVDLALQVFHQKPCTPANVTTTIRSGLQQSVADAVGSQSAEVVISDSDTGAVLAMFSGNQPDSRTLGETDIPQSPSRRQASAPGSTFKLITVAAALLDGQSSAGAPLTVLETEDGELRNSAGFTCSDDSLVTLLAESCNTSSGYLGTKLGQVEIDRVAQTYFGAFSTPKDGEASLLAFDGGDVQALTTGVKGSVPLSGGQVARTAIGQESVLSSPFAMNAVTAVVAASSAQQLENPSGGAPQMHILAGACSEGADSPDSSGFPELGATFGRLLPGSVATVLLQGMHGATSYGTAAALGNAAEPFGLDVAAKTGTAEVPESESTTKTDSWITSIIQGHLVMTVRVHDSDPTSANPAVAIAVETLPALASYLGGDTSSHCTKGNQ